MSTGAEGGEAIVVVKWCEGQVGEVRLVNMKSGVTGVRSQAVPMQILTMYFYRYKPNEFWTLTNSHHGNDLEINVDLIQDLQPFK